jgi:hypothetical protein
VLLERVVPDPQSPVLSTPILLTEAQARLALGQPDLADVVAGATLQRARKFGERIWEAERWRWRARSPPVPARPVDPRRSRAFRSALRTGRHAADAAMAARCRLGIATNCTEAMSWRWRSNRRHWAAAEFEALELPAWSQRALVARGAAARARQPRNRPSLLSRKFRGIAIILV